MKSNFSRFLHHTLSHSGIREVFTSPLSLSDLIGESRSNKVANLFHLDYRVKPDNDSVCTGRSMVEMLGVLAIIGVLSVGAIAGYSKAMMKYKLNKQTEQLNTLLTVMTRYKNEWKGIHEYIFLTPYFIKLGEIPENMIKENSDYLYDVFGNQIALRNNSDLAWNKIKINYYISNKESFELCQNVMQTAKEFKYELYSAGVYAYAGENSSGGSEYLYGDSYCENSKKCLKDLSLNDIYRLCQVCEEDNQTCLFQFLWMIE